MYTHTHDILPSSRNSFDRSENLRCRVCSAHVRRTRVSYGSALVYITNAYSCRLRTRNVFFWPIEIVFRPAPQRSVSIKKKTTLVTRFPSNSIPCSPGPWADGRGVTDASKTDFFDEYCATHRRPKNSHRSSRGVRSNDSESFLPTEIVFYEPIRAFFFFFEQLQFLGSIVLSQRQSDKNKFYKQLNQVRSV